MDVPPIDEALRELGLQGGEPPQAVRRAYLRLLKQRKPEVDPEGFRRLRAAYELVIAHAPEPAVVRLQSAPVERPPPVEVATAREPRGEEPGGEAIPALEAGIGRGVGLALVELCRVSPHSATAAHFEGVDPRWAWGALITLLGSPGRAIDPDVLRAASALALRAARADWPSPAAVAIASLALQAKYLVDEGAAVLRTASRWAAEDGLDPLGVRGFGMEWIFAHELAGLPADFDFHVRAAIAQALIEGDLRSCAGQLRDIALRYRHIAATARDLLKERAPTLHQAVGGYLSSSRPAAPPQVRLGGQGPWSGWSIGTVMKTSVESDPDGEVELECPRCNKAVRLERHAMMRQWPFRAPARTGDFYVCPQCGGTSRTAGWVFRIASAIGWSVCALLLLTAGVSLLWVLTSQDSPSPVARDLDATKAAMMAMAGAAVALIVASLFARTAGGLPQRAARARRAVFAVVAVLLALGVARAWQLDPDGTQAELIVLSGAALALGSVPFLCRAGWRLLRRRRPVAFALDKRWKPY